MSEDFLKNELDRFKEEMSRWERSLGINTMELERSLIEEIMAMSSNEMSLIDGETLGKYAYALSRYSFFLQQKENECKSFLDWSFNIEKKFISPNDKAKLNTWNNNTRLRLTRLAFLNKRVESMIQTTLNMSRNRRKE